MADAVDPKEDMTRLLERLLSRLSAHDKAACDELLVIASERMQSIAHRMLRTFPTVRRWDETNDIAQNAVLRLRQALLQITPRDPRGFLGLAAVQVRRELLDLARKYAGPESFGANQETNVQRTDGRETMKVDSAMEIADSTDQLARWTRLHEVAAQLPDEEREVFHLVWYMGLKQDAIARLLGCAVRTVKRRWDSAKKLIAKAIDGDPPR